MSTGQQAHGRRGGKGKGRGGKGRGGGRGEAAADEAIPVSPKITKKGIKGMIDVATNRMNEQLGAALEETRNELAELKSILRSHTNPINMSSGSAGAYGGGGAEATVMVPVNPPPDYQFPVETSEEKIARLEAELEIARKGKQPAINVGNFDAPAMLNSGAAASSPTKRPAGMPPPPPAMGSAAGEPDGNEEGDGIKDRRNKIAKIYLNTDPFLSSGGARGNKSSAPGRIKLVDWDSLAALQREQAGYPGLTYMSDNNLIQDKLKEVEELCTQSINQAVIGASGSFGALSGRVLVKDVAPKGGNLSYLGLRAKSDALVAYMHDPFTCDEFSKRKSAVGNSLPISIFKQAFEVMHEALLFSCAYDQRAMLALSAYDTVLEKHRKGVDRYADTSPDKMNAQQLVSSLLEIRDSYQVISTQCLAEAYQRGIDAEKVKAATAAPESSSSNPMMAKVMQDLVKSTQANTEALKLWQNKQQAAPQARKAKEGASHEDAALKQFQHNPNAGESEAAEAEKSSAQHMQKIKTLPTDPGTRISIIRKGLCSFFWSPGSTCNREFCRFAHLSRAETDALSITEAEINKALNRHIK